MRWRALAVVPLALALAACEIGAGALTGRASEDWTRTYQLGPDTRLEIVNTNGKVDVEGVDGSTVEIRAERVAKATTDQAARELLPKIKINEKVTKDRIVVETERIAGLMIGASTEVRYHVKAPKTARRTVQTTNGGIELNGLAGRTDAVTTNGGVTGERLGGALNAKSTNGGIRVALASVGPEQIALSTTNGGVRLTLPESAKASLNATTTNGGIEVSGLKVDTQEQSRRHFEGKLNGGGAVIELRTTNGGIRVRAAGSAAADDKR